MANQQAALRHLYRASTTIEPSRRYTYFDVVEGLARSYDPESYAGGSLRYQQGLPCQTGQG
jgi:hypothetical protein